MKSRIKLSASSIARFKACPERFRLADEEKLRPIEESDALRVGTNYHDLQERRQLGHSFEDIVTWLHAKYEHVPGHKTAHEWATEREMLLAMFMGHQWYWQGDGMETLATEQWFELPVHHPDTGLPLPMTEVLRHGKIDRLIQHEGRLAIGEYKTTGISNMEDFWPRLKMDTQASMYDLALHDAVAGGIFELPDLPLGGTFYDVSRKPKIKPRKLTQKATHDFTVSQEYEGRKFEVVWEPRQIGKEMVAGWLVNGWWAQATPGAKAETYSIQETPEMYGARLLADIQDRPDWYYARREIGRTDRERQQFRHTLYHLYRNIKWQQDTGNWWQDESRCDDFGGCDFAPICKYGQSTADGATPAGYKRLTKLTVKGN